MRLVGWVLQHVMLAVLRYRVLRQLAADDQVVR